MLRELYDFVNRPDMIRDASFHRALPRRASRTSAMIDSVLTAAIAAIVIVALYAFNRRFLAMKCPHCGKVVSIRGKATFICDRCHEERAL